MSKINTAKTFSNKNYSTEEFVNKIVNLPVGITNLIDSTSGKIHSEIIPSSQMDSLLWSGTTTYKANDLVYFTGKFYVSQKGSNQGNQPDISVTYWKEYTVAVERIATAYTLGQVMVDSNEGIAIKNDGTLYLTGVLRSATDTNSIDVTTDVNGGLTADLKVSSEALNNLSVSSNGVYVPKEVIVVTTFNGLTQTAGKFYFNKTDNKLYYYDGTNNNQLNIKLSNVTLSGQTLTFSLNDGTSVTCSIANLYSFSDTTSVDMTSSSGTITADVKISSESDNTLEILADGLYVPKYGSLAGLLTTTVEFTRSDSEDITWNDDELTFTHGMNSTNIMSLQVRNVTSSGTRVYTSFVPYIISSNAISINVPSYFDISQGTWQIYFTVYK